MKRGLSFIFFLQSIPIILSGNELLANCTKLMQESLCKVDIDIVIRLACMKDGWTVP